MKESETPIEPADNRQVELNFGTNANDAVDTATPQLTDGDGNKVNPPKLMDDRLAFLEDAAEQYAAHERPGDSFEQSEPDPEPEEEVEAQADPEPEEEVEAQAEPEPEPEEDIFTIKAADGTERTLTRSQVEAELSRREQADARLQRAMEREQEVQNLIQQHTKDVPQQQQAQETPAQPDIAAKVKDLMADVMNGDEEAATAKMTEMMAQPQPQQPQPNLEQIVEQTRIQVRQEAQLEAAVETFKRDYPEYMSDPNAMAMADTLSGVVQKEHPDWAPTDVLAETGRRMRAFQGEIDRQQQQEQQTQSETPDTRTEPSGPRRKAEAAKKNLEPIPQSSAAKPSSVGSEEAESVADIVQQMNIRRRGKAAYGLE